MEVVVDGDGVAVVVEPTVGQERMRGDGDDAGVEDDWDKVQDCRTKK